MTNRQIKRSKNSTRGNFDEYAASAWLKKYFIVAPVSFMVFYGAYTLVTSPPPSYTFAQPSLFMFATPSFFAFFLAFFGSVYLYKVIRKRPVRTYATVIAWIASLTLLIALAMVVPSTDKSCTGFFGALVPCSDNRAILVYLFLLNPYSLLLFEILVTLGIITLLFPLKKQKSSHK